jgi:threonine/homoserine/homoserine lactone efflux protein
MNLESFKLPIATGGSLNDLVSTIINVALIGLGLVAFAYLIYGGAQFLTSGGDADKVTSARNTILYAIIGIVVIAISWLLFSWVTGYFE